MNNKIRTDEGNFFIKNILLSYSGVPNRSAGTYAEFRLRRWRHGKFFDLLFKT